MISFCFRKCPLAQTYNNIGRMTAGAKWIKMTLSWLFLKSQSKIKMPGAISVKWLCSVPLSSFPSGLKHSQGLSILAWPFSIKNCCWTMENFTHMVCFPDRLSLNRDKNTEHWEYIPHHLPYLSQLLEASVPKEVFWYPCLCLKRGSFSSLDLYQEVMFPAKRRFKDSTLSVSQKENRSPTTQTEITNRSL